MANKINYDVNEIYFILTKSRFNMLILGCLKNAPIPNTAGLVALKKLFMDYCRSMMNKYFQVYISGKPHSNIFNVSESPKREFLEFFDISSHSYYYVDETECPKCLDCNTLKFYCSYKNPMEIKDQSNISDMKLVNYVNEYHCKICLFYIAFCIRVRIVHEIDEMHMKTSRMKKKMIKYIVQLSPFETSDYLTYNKVNDTKPLDKFLSLVKQFRTCPECNMELIHLELSAKLYGTEQYAVNRAICHDCDLVLKVVQIIEY
eukprot:304497_1